MARVGWLVALLVLLAGCSAVAPDTGPDTRTVTPAPVPSERAATPTPATGLNDSRYDPSTLTQPRTLVGVHQRVLGAQSYTVIVRETRQRPDGTALARRSTVVQHEGNRTYAVTIVAGPGQNRSVERYTEHNRTVVRVTRNDTTRYRTGGRLRTGERLYALLSAVELELVANGTTTGTYQLRATKLTEPGQFRYANRVERFRNVTFVAAVDQRGFISQYELAYNTTANDRELRVTRRVRFAALGRTSVTRPPWYGTALARTNASRTPTPAG